MSRRMICISLAVLVFAFKLSSSLSAQNLVGLAQPVVVANNHFAVEFFKAAYATSPEENVVTAPASLSYAFALLLNGSSGKGRDQIATVFDLKDVPMDEINQGNAALRALRRSHPAKKPDPKLPWESYGLVGEDGRTFQPYIMTGALWFSDGGFTPKFLSTNAHDYGYTSFPRRPTVASINQWASLQTHGKIGNIVKDVGDDDFELVTLLYFKSRWIDPFTPSQTHAGKFTLLSGIKKPVQMMPKQKEFQYLKGPNFQAVKLDFYQAAMFVFLPDEDSSLPAFVDSLTPETWQRWLSQFDKHVGILELPRFEIETTTDTEPVLEKMGLTKPFSDFSTFAPLVRVPEGARLTRVLEGTSMKVDEVGAEVKSYGIIGGVYGGVCGNCQPPPPFRMIVDHPFFFAIVDTRTNQTLFMGSIVEP